MARGSALQSFGNTDVDEAVLHAWREARFTPFREDGLGKVCIKQRQLFSTELDVAAEAN